MFGKRISTKDLYLLELVTIIGKEYLPNDIMHYTFSPEKRYFLGKKENTLMAKYEDVFTGTMYEDVTHGTWHNVGDTGVRKKQGIVTTRKWITTDEALQILQTMNPTYLPEKPKTFQKTK